jgi:hypothetical protein
METFNQSVKLVNPVDDFPAMAEELYGLNFMGEVNVGNIEVFCVNHECESLLIHPCSLFQSNRPGPLRPFRNCMNQVHP